jgi:hypothetical protein
MSRDAHRTAAPLECHKDLTEDRRNDIEKSLNEVDDCGVLLADVGPERSAAQRPAENRDPRMDPSGVLHRILGREGLARAAIINLRDRELPLLRRAGQPISSLRIDLKEW